MDELAAAQLGSFDGWRLHQGRDLRPSPRDVLLFFVGLPLFVALWATAVGIGPARVLGFQYGYLYVSIQMLAAWCVNGMTALAASRLMKSIRPPLWAILLVGFALSWVPLYLFYRYHFALFSSVFPEIVAPATRPPIGWHADYLIHAARYSLPFVPMWLMAIYGYRFMTGVQFFAAADANMHARSGPVRPDRTAPVAERQAPPVPAPIPATPSRPAFLASSRLRRDELIIAIKAEEHYIRIWSRGGNDLIRYRFGDAVQEIDDRDGAQIHRSWWINWSAVTAWRQRGRSLELVLQNGLHVPVSLAYKAEAHRRLQAARIPRLRGTAQYQSGSDTPPA